MCRRILMFMFACPLIVGVCTADDAGKRNGESAEPPHGTIAVHLKGPLHVGTTLKPEADPDSRPQDDGVWRLTRAAVEAGGAVIELDWKDSSNIRDELLWWRLPRHGDARQVQAEVTGRMVFRPPHGIADTRQAPGDVAEETPVPVVVVESLKVQLVGFDGRPRGPQYGRGRVTAR